MWPNGAKDRFGYVLVSGFWLKTFTIVLAKGCVFYLIPRYGLTGAMKVGLAMDDQAAVGWPRADLHFGTVTLHFLTGNIG